MAESASPVSVAPANRSSLPWVLLALFLVWVGVLAWMARGEFSKNRPKHERERKVLPQDRGGL
jgi:hypothetical protein